MVAGGHHDASSCSTAASEQSERRRRQSSNEEEASFKPYTCRFCPMKFAKSQALGGHMNRHRQEREREQVLHARRLVMQQDYSDAFLMPGQNPSSSLPKLCQAHPARSASESSLKDGIRMGSALPYGAASAHRRVIQPNPYNPHLGPPSHGWNLGNAGEASQNLEAAFSLEGGTVLPYQNRPAYVPSLNGKTSYIMPQPLNRAHSQHDMGFSMPIDKAMQLSMYPLDPNAPTSHGGNNLQSLQNLGEEGNFLAGSSDVTANMLSLSRSLVQKNSDMKNMHAFSQVVPLQSQQNNVAAIDKGYQFITYPGSSEGARPSLDFNVSLTNQLDALPWMHANTKTTRRPFNVSLTAKEEIDRDLENAEPKMDDGNLTVADGEQPKAMMWDLALSTQEIVDEEGKMRDFMPVMGGVSALQFDTNYDNATNREGGKEQG